MSDATVVADLAAPEMPEWFDELHATMGIGPDDPLTPDGLVTEALRREAEAAELHGTEAPTDLGDPWFRTPFEVLVDSIERDGNLSPFGRFQVRELFTGLLCTRLRLAALIERHPEILDIPIEAPVIVLGLPRTGTSHLLDLLAADTRFRSMPYWESLEPILPGDGRAPTGAPDPRIERAELGLTLMNSAMPLFPAMHEMTTFGPHEEIQLLAVDFSTMLFEASYEVPTYAAWYRANDQTHAYRTMKVLLQAMRFLRPEAGERWVLKSPQHLEQLGPLLEVFPDARIVQTHRDPVAVITSMATMAAYTRRTNYDEIDPIAMGPVWAARIETLLTAAVRDRHLVPDDQVLDVRFHEYMADQWSVVEAVYELAGQPLTDAARAQIQGAMDDNPRGKHGRVRYRLADVGLDANELRAALRGYQERFAVPDEAVE